MIDLSIIFGMAGAPVITALTELVKRTFPSLSSRYFPLISVVIGICLNLGIAAALAVDLRLAAVTGILAGLAASGLYSWVKNVVEQKIDSAKGERS